MEYQELLERAVEVAKESYSPYSKFRVGAALLAQNGTIYCGTNVENASYGLTICAERSAIFGAVSKGCRNFRAIAIVADGDLLPYPCGACRQVLAEFCDGNFDVVVASINDIANYRYFKLDDLLPHRFGKSDTGGRKAGRL